MQGEAQTISAGRSMTSSRDTLRSFTDAAADAVAREIATLRREAQHERQLRDAQFAARVAELEVRISAVSEIERRLAERLASLKDGEPGRSVTADDVRPMLAEMVAEAVRAIPAPRDGRDVDPEAVAALVDETVARAVATIPPAQPGKDGESVTVEDVAPMLADMVRDAVAALPPAEPGKSVTIADVEPLIRSQVAEAVAAIPPVEAKEVDPAVVRQMVDAAVAALPAPRDGKNADPEDVARLVAETVRAAVDALPPAERGEPGPMGALPVVREWEDRVYYEGDVVSFDGAVYQAARDTGKSPEHADWTCIVAKGRDGADGRSFTIRGTWTAETDYRHLDVVAIDGAAFVARRDEPGPCPGEGWQMIAMRGKSGRPGDKGNTGVGLRGLPGPAVSRIDIDDQGLLRLVNADGSAVECDLYPLLSRLA